MALGWGGTYEQRLVAINRYMQLVLARNTELEQGFYHHAKEAFGPDRLPAHTPRGIYAVGDAFKNGYDWWGATRDYGQTDEHWPIPYAQLWRRRWVIDLVQPILCPASGPYSRNSGATPAPGPRESASAVAFRGGCESVSRDFHQPLHASGKPHPLLNLIQPAPLDCPVAIVFGHAASLNWEGPHFGDLGEGFAAELGKVFDVHADIIPSSEITSGALKLDGNGWLTYGVQRYRAMVFLNPDFEGPETFFFLRRVAQSQTQVFVHDETRLSPTAKSAARKR